VEIVTSHKRNGPESEGREARRLGQILGAALGAKRQPIVPFESGRRVVHDGESSA